MGSELEIMWNSLRDAEAEYSRAAITCMNTFAFLKIATALIFPPASLAVAVILAGLLTLVGWRRLRSVVLGLAIAQTLVLSFQPVGDGLVLSRESGAGRRRGAPACCYDAIVVLGGGISPAYPPEQPEPDLNDSSDRIWEGARLYHRGVAPRIVITGGSFRAQHGGPPTTEADAMSVSWSPSACPRPPSSTSPWP